MSLSGFFNAPVSKGLLLSTVGSTVFALFTNLAPKHYQLSLSGLSTGQLWRLLTSQMAFGSAGELIVGLMLSYMARTFERQMGSRKFGAFVLLSGAIGASIQTAAVLQFSSVRRVSPGPYSVIFALMVLYYAGAPKMQPRLLGGGGFDLSEKSLTYLLAAQLMFSGGLESILPSVSGLLAGCAYRSDTLGLNKVCIPAAVVRVLSPLKWVFGSRRPSGLPGDPQLGQFLRPRSGGDNTNSGREQLIGDPFGGGFGRPAFPRAPAPQPLPPPSEQDVQTIVDMGFGRDAAVRALTQHNNNVERAINSLLAH